jgi:hypothetical protein
MTCWLITLSLDPSAAVCCSCPDFSFADYSSSSRRSNVQLLQGVVHSMALDLAACKQELAEVKAAAATAAVQARQQIAALELQLAQQKAVPASRSTPSPMRARVAEVVDMLQATCGE